MVTDKNKKARAWTFLIYPESQPHWRELLESVHMPAIVSPLHDADTWTQVDELNNHEHKAGELKKPHYHAMIIFDGGARASQALTALDPLGIKHVESVTSVRTLTRYFAHMDDADKAQYNPADILSLGGAYVDTTRDLSPEEQRAIKFAVMSWMRENNITEYEDVVNYAMDCEPDWFDYVEHNTIFITRYLSSVRHRYKD